MDTLTLTTFNVRGSRDPLKRCRIRDFCRQHKCSIVNLQETHCKEGEEAKIWANEWLKEEPCVWRNDKSEYIDSNYTSRSRGSMCLMDNNKASILDSKSLFEGRATFALTKIEEFDFDKIIIVNVYAPNGKKDRADFFIKLLQEIKDWQILHQCRDLILTGDFNCVTDSRDKNVDNFQVDKDESARVLLNLRSELDLTDIWRKLNPDKRQYTWRQIDTTNNRRNIATRLDRWYVSSGLIGNVEKCYIVPCTISDHLPVMLKLRSLKNIKRGPGLWKFNNSLLECQYFCQEINTFWRGWQLLKPAGDEILTWWDEGKDKIKEIAIRISRNKARIKNQLLRKLTDEFQEKIKLHDRAPNIENAEALKEAKRKVETLDKEKTKGSRIRARVQWQEKGEKSDRYFLRLENYRGKLKTITRIRKEDGQITENIEEILETQRRFYKSLYTESNTDENMQRSFLDEIDTQLDNTERDSCEGLIDPIEAKRAMKGLSNNKSPGSDGLSKEFYEHFWDLLSRDLIEVFNISYVANRLTETQRTAVITLLYKHGEREDIKNWRPISLLNVDFKIIAKCLANRLKKCIGKLVHPDQTCGIKGRTIFENIIVAQDAIFISNRDNKPLAIISVDQTKAFDRLNRGFMIKTLRKFGFGESFINWINTLYMGITSKICTNGYISEPFHLERGVRQGCPLSPMLYTLTTEALLCAIRKSPNISGFRGPSDTEIKVKGYADDTAVYVRDIESVQNTIDLIKKFGLASESKINLDKTNVLLCGPLRREKPNDSLINYIEDKVKVLGVWVGNVDTVHLNWVPVVNKISKILGMWSSRDLTIKGKATIVNTLALSKVWHLASVSVPPDFVCEQIQEAIHKFVWTSKTKLVNREMLSIPAQYGGVNCIDVRMKAKSLKVKWLLKITGDTNLCNSLILGKHFLQNFDKTFTGLSVLTTNLRNVRNDRIPIFYQDIVTTWQTLKYKRKFPSAEAILNEFLFANPVFMGNGDTLYYLNWIQNGMLKVRDIWTNRRLATVYELMRKHNIPERDKERLTVQYQNIKNAIPQALITILQRIDDDGVQIDQNAIIDIKELFQVNKESLQSKQIYERLMYVKLQGFQRGYQVLDNAGVDEDRINLEELEAWWNKLYKSDLDNKSKEFQWRVSNKALYTLPILHGIDPEISSLCVLCKHSEETVDHLFAKCTKIIPFWEWIFAELGFHTELSDKLVYTNNHENQNNFNFFITVLVKCTIWEVRNILRKSQMLHILDSLKVNFKYKLMSTLTTLYHAYLMRNEHRVFAETYVRENKIEISNNKIIIRLRI